MDTLRMKRLSVVATVVLMLIMVLPRGGSALEVSISPLASCAPDCTDTPTGNKVVDPQNCTNYYYCFDGHPASHPISCGDGSHFDPDHGCVPGEGCDPVCGGNSDCAITCNGTMHMVSNPFDCSTYYVCFPGNPSIRTCPPDRPYFNGIVCTHDESDCCSPYCDVNCDGSGFARVPDPKDCGSFYVCEKDVESDPGPEYKFSCGAGKYFNIALGYCETGNPNSCTTLCDAATGVGGDNSIITSTSTTTTTTATSTGDCVSSFTCPAAGYFPACQTCQPEYFKCAGADVPGEKGTCSNGAVFNPTPDLGFCVLPANCPYP